MTKREYQGTSLQDKLKSLPDARREKIEQQRKNQMSEENTTFPTPKNEELPMSAEKAAADFTKDIESLEIVSNEDKERINTFETYINILEDPKKLKKLAKKSLKRRQIFFKDFMVAYIKAYKYVHGMFEENMVFDPSTVYNFRGTYPTGKPVYILYVNQDGFIAGFQDKLGLSPKILSNKKWNKLESYIREEEKIFLYFVSENVKWDWRNVNSAIMISYNETEEHSS